MLESSSSEDELELQPATSEGGVQLPRSQLGAALFQQSPVKPKLPSNRQVSPLPPASDANVGGVASIPSATAAQTTAGSASTVHHVTARTGSLNLTTNSSTNVPSGQTQNLVHANATITAAASVDSNVAVAHPSPFHRLQSIGSLKHHHSQQPTSSLPSASHQQNTIVDPSIQSAGSPVLGSAGFSGHAAIHLVSSTGSAGNSVTTVSSVNGMNETNNNDSAANAAATGSNQFARSGSGSALFNRLGSKRGGTADSNAAAANGSNCVSTGAGHAVLTSSFSTENQQSDLEPAEKQEQLRKHLLQLYVFVVRCVSYPFNAKQPLDLPRRPPRLSLEQLQLIRVKLDQLLLSQQQHPLTLAGQTTGDTATGSGQPTTADGGHPISFTAVYAGGGAASEESFLCALHAYQQCFLHDDRAELLVRSGAATLNDFKHIFRQLAERRARQLPNLDGYSRDALLGSWLNRLEQLLNAALAEEDAATLGFNSTNTSAASYSAAKRSVAKPSPAVAAAAAAAAAAVASSQTSQPAGEPALTKEQLYDMFQHILSIKKFEHQLLFNALQVPIFLTSSHVFATNFRFFWFWFPFQPKFSWTLRTNRRPPFVASLTVECKSVTKWKRWVRIFLPSFRRKFFLCSFLIKDKKVSLKFWFRFTSGFDLVSSFKKRK